MLLFWWSVGQGSPVQNGCRLIQLLGVLLSITHVIGQTHGQSLGQVTDFLVQLVMKRTQLIGHLLQVLTGETNTTGH